MRGLIIIPAFNEDPVIERVLNEIPKKIDKHSLDIIVINDCSNDKTLSKALKTRVTVLSHIINRGAGAAIRTGMEWAKLQNYEFAVTFDSDGQHNPKDLKKIIDPLIEKKADIVVGSRLKSKQKMPFDRLVINWMANLYTLALYGIFSTDTQSGLRSFSKKALTLIDFKGERYDYSSEIFLEAKKHKLKILEVPSSVIYTDYSRKKGQKNTNIIAMTLHVFLKILR
jgi:UDP-N-acetylglucosamine---dolichyl-phosphate N-acetylglucosaminyltransferase